MTAKTRPRLMQLCFLTLAAFMLTNKVWSPQYVLWLIPFAVLARPNWKAIVLWQIAECWYFFAIWLYWSPSNPATRPWASPATPTSPRCGAVRSPS